MPATLVGGRSLCQICVTCEQRVGLFTSQRLSSQLFFLFPDCLSTQDLNSGFSALTSGALPTEPTAPVVQRLDKFIQWMISHYPVCKIHFTLNVGRKTF